MNGEENSNAPTVENGTKEETPTIETPVVEVPEVEAPKVETNNNEEKNNIAKIVEVIKYFINLILGK